MSDLIGKKGDQLVGSRCILVLPGGVALTIGEMQLASGQVVVIADAPPVPHLTYRVDDMRTRTFHLTVKE